jgi:hypothetical protein
MKQIYEKKMKHRHYKRRLATEKGAKFDLKEELPLMFKAFKEAHELYESEIIQTPPLARGRGFEASLLNSKMLQCIQKYFPNNWKFGKYKRFTLRVNGYIILFKKLDKNNMPMNIKTNSVRAISQQLSLPLFSEASYVEEPILFFGYKKNSVGVISDPKLVYLDENRIQWIVTLDNITIDKTKQLPKKIQKAIPILKKGKKRTKRVG